VTTQTCRLPSTDTIKFIKKKQYQQQIVLVHENDEQQALKYAISTVLLFQVCHENNTNQKANQ